MRSFLYAMLLAGLGFGAAPAQAAQIVQQINPSLYIPAYGFDPSLGTLNSVAATVNLTTYRQWFVDTPAGSPTNTITWSINSFFDLVGYGLASNSGLPLTVATAGSGSLTQNNGLFTVSATGSGTFNLNPAAFNGIGRFTIAEFDPGLSNPAINGTIVTSSVPATLFQTPGTCFGTFSGSDLCGSGYVRLTYDYNPVAAAVPEPATWAMMLFGFAAVGYSIRRRRANVRVTRRSESRAGCHLNNHRRPVTVGGSAPS